MESTMTASPPPPPSRRGGLGRPRQDKSAVAVPGTAPVDSTTSARFSRTRSAFFSATCTNRILFTILPSKPLEISYPIQGDAGGSASRLETEGHDSVYRTFEAIHQLHGRSDLCAGKGHVELQTDHRERPPERVADMNARAADVAHVADAIVQQRQRVQVFEDPEYALCRCIDHDRPV